MLDEKRVDPEDGQAYTYDELGIYYKGKYKRKVIDDYWSNTCMKTPIKAPSKLKPNAKAQERLFDSVLSHAAKCLGKIAAVARFHRERQLTDDYFLKSDVLGDGYNGFVYKAISRTERSNTYAVKDFDLRGINTKKMDELEGECRNFLSMDHPHVARLVDVYQSRNKLSLVMECMDGGEVFDRVLERQQFSEDQSADAAYQMLLAINYVHGRGYVHGDIKLENFMYEEKDSDHIKLIDFGSSKLFDPSLKVKRSIAHLGTLDYAAPEVLAGSYTDKSDMWSLGVVVFILLTGYIPFSDEDGEEVERNRIRNGEFIKQEAWYNVSCTASAFVKQLLEVDPSNRPTAEGALQHEFIVKRSRLAATAATAEVDAGTVDSLYTFAHASKFRRACMSAMAWSMTNEDRSALRESFLTMDKTKSGIITLGEFEASIKERLNLTDVEVKEVFDVLDASKTGVIHYTEFLAAMMASRVQLHDPLLKATFHRFDVCGTGFIEGDDLVKLLDQSFEGQDLASLLKEADTSGDGKISYQEFVEFAKQPVSQEEGHHACLGGS